MKDSFFLLVLLIPPLCLHAQWRTASLEEDLSIRLQRVKAPGQYLQHRRSATGAIIKDGYPKTFPAHPAFKNFRNVTLADLDQDGAEEIIAGIADHLYVFKNDSLWWAQSLSGLARFPAAVADIDVDNKPEIVLLTGFNNQPGQVYVFSPEGNVERGWPLSFDGHWMISSPALADLDQDDTLEIICSDLDGEVGQVYVLRHDGRFYNDQWPITLPNIPAVTPSIADLNNDRRPEIVVASTREIYVFDGQAHIVSGWPYGNGLSKFSFQSPLLSDLNNDGSLEIIFESHGDLPQFLLFDHQGLAMPGWPINVPGNSWTFHTPTLIIYENEPIILTARPIAHSAGDMLYAWRTDGSSLPQFPIVKEGGLEGIITASDLDDDGEPEILFPSNLFDTEGYGFIHAYKLDGSGELPGFPLRPYGLTYLNGATIGDIDGDDMMDLVVLSYTENPADQEDSTFLYAYDLGINLDVEKIAWSTYKGNNLRNGSISLPQSTPIQDYNSTSIIIYPNPAQDHLVVESDEMEIDHGIIVDSKGMLIMEFARLDINDQLVIPLSDPSSGLYFIQLKLADGSREMQKFVIQ